MTFELAYWIELNNDDSVFENHLSLSKINVLHLFQANKGFCFLDLKKNVYPKRKCNMLASSLVSFLRF